jgi:hypothetical protein
MRYHFNIVDGIDVPDYNGTILANEAQARLYAAQMLIYLKRGKRTEKIQKYIEVTDDRGVEVFRLAVPFKKAARVRPAGALKN